jgi:hypothetical protein
LKWTASYVFLTLVWPVASLLFAMEGLLHNSSRSRAAPVGRMRQFRDLFVLTLTKNVMPRAYYKYCMWLYPRDGREAVMDQLEINRGFERVGNYRNEAAVLRDKAAFQEALTRAGVPTVPDSTLLRATDGVDAIRALLMGVAVGSGVFIKPADGHGGHGAAAWQRGTDGWLGSDSEEISTDDLAAYIKKRLNQYTILLQPRLRNHEDLRDFSVVGLSTLRVVTLRNYDGSVECVGAALRIPLGDSITDNMCSGGAAAGVSLDGILSAARTESRPHADITVHPDTGRRIAGETLPFFAEMVELACSAHELFPTIRSIGWDVATCESGPLIIEANSGWSGDVMQIGHQRPLLDIHPSIGRCFV